MAGVSLQSLQKPDPNAGTGMAPARTRSLAEINAMPKEKQFPAMLESFRTQIAAALPKHLTPERMARIALTAFNSTPALRTCTPISLFQAVILSSQLGLEIGVDGESYLVPYKGQATFVPGWKGIVKLINNAKQAGVWTGAVFKGDAFEYQLGDQPFCRHKPMGTTDENKANLTHVYAIGRVHGAEHPIIEVWPVAKVERHLKRYNKVGDKHYALANDNNFIQYGKKVALLQVAKYLPRSVELRAALASEAGADLDLGSIIDGDFVNVADAVPEADGSVGDTGGDDGAREGETVDKGTGEVKPADGGGSAQQREKPADLKNDAAGDAGAFSME